MSVQSAPNRAASRVVPTHRAAKSSVRIALISEDIILQISLRKIVETVNHGCLLESYLKGEQASHFIRVNPPTMVLMDGGRSRFEALAFLRDLRSLCPDLPIVMLDEAAGPSEICQALRAGAAGYFIAPLSSHQLVDALGASARGWPALCQKAQEAVVDWLLHGDLTRWHGLLSSRQRQIVPFLFGKLPDKQIASVLGLSAAVMDDLLMGVFKKLAAHTRYEAVCRLLGLVERTGYANGKRQLNCRILSPAAC